MWVREIGCACAAMAVIAAAAGPVSADTTDWQVNEVLRAGEGGDAAVRYVELYNGPGGCLFGASRIEVFDGGGRFLGAAAPFAATTCFGADTYFLFATAAAASAFGVEADHGVVPPLPADGQLCFASSTIRYDCVRWGVVSAPIADFFGPDDASAAVSPPAGIALARVATTHVVSVDWGLAEGTPRGPNDGTPWFPPDAGIDGGGAIDAGAEADGGEGEVDAAAADAAEPDARPDARNDSFLDLEAAGGASCGCRSGGGGGGGGSVVVVVAAIAWVGRRRVRVEVMGDG
jgi:hypothetical protein